MLTQYERELAINPIGAGNMNTIDIPPERKNIPMQIANSI